MEFEFESGLFVVSAGLMVLVGVLFLLFSRPRKKSDPSILDPRKLHPPKVFYKYSHDSIYHWVAWVKSQDTKIQEKAINQLIHHLTNPVSKLGLVSSDAIRALVEFTSDRSYFILSDLLLTCTNALGLYKSIEIFYEDLAVGLTKFNRPQETEKILLEIFADIKNKPDLVNPQVAVLKALARFELSDTMIEIFDEILSSRHLNSKVRTKVLEIISAQSPENQKKIYLMILENQLKNQQGILREEDEKLLSSIFERLKKFFTDDECSDYLWDLMNRGINSQRHGSYFIKLFSEAIEQKDDSLSTIKLLELLDKPEPARTSFREAFVHRNGLDRKEQEVIRTNVKPEDLIFEKSTCKADKNKTSRSVAAELLNDYKSLEKDLIMIQENSKTDKVSQSINVILGNGIDEKLYLMRALAANNNRSFVYVDALSLFSDANLIQTFRTTVGNCKPCLVYMDCLELFLEKNLTKSEYVNVKNVMRVVSEFSILPSVRFVANIPYSRDDLMSTYSLINERLLVQSHGNYRIINDINKPDFMKRRNLVSYKFADIKPERFKAESESFDIDNFAESTEEMSYLDYSLLLSQYFEISLMIFGRLISYSEFKELNEIRFPTESPVQL